LKYWDGQENNTGGGPPRSAQQVNRNPTDSVIVDFQNFQGGEPSNFDDVKDQIVVNPHGY